MEIKITSAIDGKNDCFNYNFQLRICDKINECEYCEDFICTKDDFELCYLEEEKKCAK